MNFSFLKEKNKLLIIVLAVSIALTSSGCEIFPGVDITLIKEKDGGIFKSVDGGYNWQQKVKTNTKTTLASKSILSIDIDPKDPKVIFVGTNGDGIYKTVDEGETWFKLSDENGILNPQASIYDIAIDPKNNSYIYISAFQGERGRVLKSSDGGKSWHEIYLSQTPQEIVTDIEPDSLDTQIIYLATSKGGFFKSINYGASWEFKTFFERSIEKIIIDPEERDILWIISGNGIYKSSDRGSNWQSFEEQIKDTGSNSVLTALAINPSDHNNIYFGSAQGMFKTNNSGRSWTKVNIITPSQTISISDIIIHPGNSLIIYYAAGSVLYKSIDGGVTWTIHDIKSKKTIKEIILDPTNPEIIYLGLAQNN